MFTHADSRHVAHSRRAARSGLRELIAGVDDLLRSTASYGGADVESTRDRLKQRLDHLRDYAGDWDHAADRYRRLAGAADGYVRHNGWKAAGVGIALGILAGICLMSGAGRR